MAATATSLFEPAGDDRWIPTELARGPWDPRACHGGPVGALIARAVECADPDSVVAWQIARLTIELTLPVPVGRPLAVSTEIERDGRKVSLVAVRLHAGDTEVARARSLRIRANEFELPDDVVQPSPDPPGTPADGIAQRPVWAMDDSVAFHRDACEHRFTESALFDTDGRLGRSVQSLIVDER